MRVRVHVCMCACACVRVCVYRNMQTLIISFNILFVAFSIDKDETSYLAPEQFEEVVMRIYTKKSDEVLLFLFYKYI